MAKQNVQAEKVYSLFLADVVTPEEQEQVFAANVHNLCKMAGILLQECAEN